MSLSSLARKIVRCNQCPRLRQHCEKTAIEKRRAYQNNTYWGKPVPGFGDHKFSLLIVGLAPGAHGANRTGRMFTGDRSGDWLYRALHKAGFANQPESRDRNDGLELTNAYVTNAVRCAPPGNKPTPEEIQTCTPFLDKELEALPSNGVILCLGGLACNAVWKKLGSGKKPKFSHGGEVELESGQTLLMSYHPSQQNTFTGRLTEPMFDHVFSRARDLLFGGVFQGQKGHDLQHIQASRLDH